MSLRPFWHSTVDITSFQSVFEDCYTSAAIYAHGDIYGQFTALNQCINELDLHFHYCHN